jgi:predicted unusual protein kinase regulating ubiquinone biosynthesis (AarF/ABC1/UbiB family)
MKFRHNNLFCLQIQEYTTMHALVMEYIEGPAIDDKEKLLADGCDKGEVDVMEVKMDLIQALSARPI